MSKHLVGVHDFDPTWAAWVRDAGASAWCVTTHEYGDLHELSHMAAYNVTPIARLNWSHHGKGTIPPADFDDDFAVWCATFAAKNKPACAHFIIANEPNWSVEWGGGPPITPQRYVECYVRAYDAIKSVRPDAVVMPAAIAPWNVESGMGWVEYFDEMMHRLEGRYDAINLHTYSRGYMPSAITSEDRMDAPWDKYRNGFRTYRDFLAVVPASRRHLPVHITETNGNGVWPAERSGWVQAAYAEIDGWNATAGTQKIASLVLFRWPRFDAQWQFETKLGAHEDLRDALRRNYRVPDAPPAVPDIASPAPHPSGNTLFLPSVQGGGTPPPPAPSTDREWDERLTARGVRVVTPELRPGQAYWRVKSVRWYDVEEARRVGPDHHILVDMIDERGQRTPGQQLLVEWSGERAVIVTEAKPGERWSANYPMSPSRNEFSIRPASNPAERVTGIGMGADLGDGFNAAHHTSTEVVFELAIASGVQPAPVAPQPEPPAVGERWVHPVRPDAPVSQAFGVNPAVYARFGLDGHNGIDFAVVEGTPIYAVAAGTVAESGEMASYGRYVKLVHGWGETLYAHLSRALVRANGAVVAGQVIGLSGNTGFSTGPHLHFGMRRNPFTRGRPFDGFSDPTPFLREATAATAQADVREMLPAAAREFGVRPALLASLVWAESSYRWWAESSAGAQGLAQIMPATWDEWSVKVGARDPWDAQDNLRVGAAYLAWCIRTAGDQRRGVAAYAWGIGNVQRGGEWPAVVREYANKVTHGADLLDAWGVFVEEARRTA